MGSGNVAGNGAYAEWLICYRWYKGTREHSCEENYDSMNTLGTRQKNREKWQNAKHYVTRDSHLISLGSTSLAQPSLTAVIEREPVFSGWYERSMKMRSGRLYMNH